MGDEAWDPAAIVAKALDEIKVDVKVSAAVNELESDHGLFRADREQLEDQESSLLPPGAEINDMPVPRSFGGIESDVAASSCMQVHTICYKPEEEDKSEEENESERKDKTETDAPSIKVPIVMLHGLGGSSVEFHKNYRKLSKDRTVYGIDIPGFGLSSRDTNYCSSGCTDPSVEDVKKCEEKLVDLVEIWREQQNIEEMILVGHSFGGYVAMVYATKHREHVRQLVLIEPWGILSEEQSEEMRKGNPHYLHNSFFIRLAMAVSKPLELRPFSLLRGIGYGIGSLIFGRLVPSSHQDAYGKDQSLYFIGLNTLYDPRGSGEDLFRMLSGGSYMYPVISFLSRLDDISSYPPMSVIYGKSHKVTGDVEVSYVQEGEIMKEKMLKVGLHDVEIVEAPTSSHHAHAENPKWFHRHMEKLLEDIDKTSGDKTSR